MKFIISKRARRHIEMIQAWWVENRTSAPALFLDELAGAERRLRTNPTLGLVYTAHKSGVVRRVLLTRTSHHLYYRYLPVSAHTDPCDLSPEFGAQEIS